MFFTIRDQKDLTKKKRHTTQLNRMLRQNNQQLRNYLRDSSLAMINNKNKRQSLKYNKQKDTKKSNRKSKNKITIHKRKDTLQ